MVQVVGEKMAGYSLADVVRVLSQTNSTFQGSFQFDSGLLEKEFRTKMWFPSQLVSRNSEPSTVCLIRNPVFLNEGRFDMLVTPEKKTLSWFGVVWYSRHLMCLKHLGKLHPVGLGEPLS